MHALSKRSQFFFFSILPNLLNHCVTIIQEPLESCLLAGRCVKASQQSVLVTAAAALHFPARKIKDGQIQTKQAHQ